MAPRACQEHLEYECGILEGLAKGHKGSNASAEGGLSLCLGARRAPGRRNKRRFGCEVRVPPRCDHARQTRGLGESRRPSREGTAAPWSVRGRAGLRQDAWCSRQFRKPALRSKLPGAKPPMSIPPDDVFSLRPGVFFFLCPCIFACRRGDYDAGHWLRATLPFGESQAPSMSERVGLDLSSGQPSRERSSAAEGLLHEPPLLCRQQG